jgi:hypothetical protein
MRLFFACLAACVVSAAWFEAPLSWDGAYCLFKVLDEGVPFVPISRYVHVPFQIPVLIARHAGVEDLRVLRLLYAIPYALLPSVCLALSWWIVRARRPELFVWPALSIALSNLTGLFFMVSEGPIAIALFWPIVLALLVGSVTRRQLVVLIVAGTLAWLAHPMAGLLAGACGMLAWLLATKGRFGDEGRSGWILGAILIAAAGAKLLMPLSDYEERSLSVKSFLDPLRATTWGWPRVSLAATFVATMLVFLQPWILKRIGRRVSRGVLVFGPAALALAAGVAMIPWARSESRWASAFNYRFVMNALSACFLVAATIEGLREAARPGFEEGRRGRTLTVLAAALSLLLVLTLQGVAWSRLRDRFARDLASKRPGCVPITLLDSVPRTSLTHWSSTSLSIVLQGRAPERVAMTEAGCQELAETGSVRIAPWDLRRRDGWFRLPK